MEKVKTVFISGNFNVLHPGHQRIIKFASEIGEKVIVGVYSDRIAKNNSLVPEEYRLEGVKNNIYISESFLLDEEIEEYLSRVKPKVIVKGKEWEFKYNREESSLKEYGGKLLFSSGGPIFSSKELLSQSSNLEIFQKKSLFPDRFSRRHNFSKKRLVDVLASFSELNVCVIGDTIIDEYISCAPLGMSQEDPSIVVTPTGKARFLGGAGIVAKHAASLGANVHFLSVVGDDLEKEYVLSELEVDRLHPKIAIDANRLTTLKQRFQAEGKSLLKVSHLTQDSIDESIQTFLLSAFEEILPKVDMVVFSDFNYGCLPQSLVEEMISKSKNADKLLVSDSQSSSQIGDISRFKGMDIVFATEREARISLQNPEDGLVILADKLRENSQSKNIFLKLGSEGVLLHIQSEDDPSSYITDRLNSLNESPKDTAGAGDSMLITSSLARCCGASFWEAACLGTIASSIQVGRVGNIPLTMDEFKNFLSA
jgi:rfaE bifunctional protein kinase chain/domain